MGSHNSKDIFKRSEKERLGTLANLSEKKICVNRACFKILAIVNKQPRSRIRLLKIQPKENITNGPGKLDS